MALQTFANTSMTLPQGNAIHSTIQNFLREVEPIGMRNWRSLDLVKKLGRVKYNQTGTFYDWRLHYRIQPTEDYTPVNINNFVEQDLYETAQLEPRGFKTTDAMTNWEKMINRGQPALIDRFKEIPKAQAKSMFQTLQSYFWIDGNAAGNTGKFHGINSFMGVSGADSGGYIGTNNDTYAGLSTALGAKGGSWTGTWPVGDTLTFEYDYHTPLVVDYTDTLWSAAAHTWAANAFEVITWSISNGLGRNGGWGDDRTSMFGILNNELFRLLALQVHANQQITFQANDAPDAERSVSFGPTLIIENIPWGGEFGVPATEGFLIDFANVEIRTPNAQLFVTDGSDYSLNSDRWRWLQICVGNYIFKNVKNFVKYDNIT